MTRTDTNLHEAAQDAPIVFLTIEEVASRVGLSRRTLYNRMAQDETFPKPVNVSARRIRFVEAEVSQWQRGMMDGRGK